jgi:DNA-dependent RNA polymerase
MDSIEAKRYDLTKLLEPPQEFKPPEAKVFTNSDDEINFVITVDDVIKYDALTQLQLEIERDMRSRAREKYLERQDRLVSTGQATSDSTFIGLMKQYIPRTVDNLKAVHTKLIQEKLDPASKNDYSLLPLIDRFVDVLGYHTIAVVAFEKILDILDLSKGGPVESILVRNIGEILDFEAFMKYVEATDPEIIPSIGGYDLQAKGRSRKFRAVIERAGKHKHLAWDWLEEADVIRLGNWAMEGVMYGTGLFESKLKHWAEDKTQYVITLSEEGRLAKDQIQDCILHELSENLPMVIPPRDWDQGGGRSGGYLTPGPRMQGAAIHNNSGSRPSPTAIRAINNLQRQAWRVNTFIYDLQEALLTNPKYMDVEIKAFRRFDLDRFIAMYSDLEDPELAKISWEEAKEDPEILSRKKRAYRAKKQLDEELSKKKQKAMPTARVHSVAMRGFDMPNELHDKFNRLIGSKMLRFRDLERFYTPWYFDSRLRMYPLVDTIQPQGADYAKAIIEFADGYPVSEESKRDLLISIATSFGQGLDKASYDDRVKGAEELMPMFELLATKPLDQPVYDLWTSADEPFQFLALVHEFVKIFIWKTQNEHHVSGGRDATCSGIQIAGALLKDPKTCKLVNVLPSPEPQDAYRAVAEEALKLLSDPEWVEKRVQRREENRRKKAERDIKIQQKLVNEGKREAVTASYEPRYECHVQTELVNRSVAKMIVMLTPYGGSYKTMLGHVQDKMMERGAEMHKADYAVLTHALIEGMANALPGFSALNDWFKSLARAVITIPDELTGKKRTQIEWHTPNGSRIVQQYLEVEEQVVKTYTHGQTKVRLRQYQTSRPSKQLKERKMQTALAANTIHSLDACIIQDAVAGYSLSPFAAVHDCVYAPSGAIQQLVERVKHAFHNTVTSNFLEGMLEDNELDENEEIVTTLKQMTFDGTDCDIDEVYKSEYLFS